MKVIQKVGSLILAGLTCLAAALSLSPLFETKGAYNASADEFERQSRTDVNFEFSPGAAVRTDADEDTIEGLRFGIKLKNTDLESFLDHEEDFATTVFTMYREDEKGPKGIYQIYTHTMGGNDGSRITVWAHKTLEFDENFETDAYLGSSISFSPSQMIGDVVLTYSEYDTFSNDEKSLYDVINGPIENIGFTLNTVIVTRTNAEKPFTYEEENGYPMLYVNTYNNSPHAHYFLGVDYRYSDFSHTYTTGALWWKKNQKAYNVTEGSIMSDTRSVATVLKNMKDAGALNAEMGNDEGLIAEANSIITYATKREVKISYLKKIPNTPFAQKVTKSVQTYLKNGSELLYDDAAVAVGEELHCLGSNVKNFVYDEESQAYVANYLTAIALTAKTEDGNSLMYYLDINKSYYDVYHELIENTNDSPGVDSDKIYEYFWSQASSRYPGIAGMSDTNIYGYFGHVIIPTTFSWNSIWNLIFQVPTTFTGVIEKFSYVTPLTLTSYNCLLSEYGYKWYEKIWNSVYTVLSKEGAHSATHWIFFADPKIKDPVISEDGSTNAGDGMGSIGEGLKDTITGVVDGVTGTVENIQNATNDMSEIEKSLAALKAIAGLALVGGAVFFVIWGIGKLKGRK